jgi:hypothetical protein
MEENIEKILETKQKEIDYITGIIKNLNYLKQLYSKGVLEDAKNLFAICNALKSWEERIKHIRLHVDSIESKVTPEILGNEVVSFTEYVGGVLDEVNEAQNNVPRFNINNTTKKDWLKSVNFFEHKFQSSSSTKKIFIDDDIIENTKGFMCGPVGIFNNGAVEATTQSFASLQELKDWVVDESSKRDMVIYMTFEENGKYYWRGDLINR